MSISFKMRSLPNALNRKQDMPKKFMRLSLKVSRCHFVANNRHVVEYAANPTHLAVKRSISKASLVMCTWDQHEVRLQRGDSRVDTGAQCAEKRSS